MTDLQRRDVAPQRTEIPELVVDRAPEYVDDSRASQGPLVHGEPLLDEHEISGEITSGSSSVMGGALRVARAFEHARVRGTLDSTMHEHGFERSQAYSLASVWGYYGPMVLDGTLAEKVEGLTPSHLATALKGEDPMKELAYAQDQKESTRAMKARLRGDSERSENVETRTEFKCPHCPDWHALSGVETREVAV